ncbi:MAG: PAS domain S-box protein [Rhodocyclaceae bacterium]|nr:PAS domain S-box protein [Rhodocyclaceae bacterium]
MTARAQWRLRTLLIWLLAAALAAAFALIGTAVLLYRLPQITEESRAELHAQGDGLAQRTEALLGALETQLDLLAAVLRMQGDDGAQALIEYAIIRSGAFTAIYHLDAAGRVRQVAVAPGPGRAGQGEVADNDFSGDRLFRRVMERQAVTWSDKYLSPVSGVITVGVAIPVADGALIGEVSLPHVLRVVHSAAGRRGSAVWLLDRAGEILADSESPARVGVVNLSALPLFDRALKRDFAPDSLEFEGRTFDAAIAHSRRLDWFFLVRAPAGLANPQAAATLWLAAAAFAGSLVLGLLLAVLWATWMARPISAIAERTRRVAEGGEAGEWPRGRVAELNALSEDLGRMAEALRDREKELETIFDASPVAMLAADAGSRQIVKVNDSMVRLLGHPREELVGSTGRDLRVWDDRADAEEVLRRLDEGQDIRMEARLLRKDGSRFLASVQARVVRRRGRLWSLWVAEDITEKRRIEAEVRALNTELEERVLQRTEQLRGTNEALSRTLENLQAAQEELVRVEKQASLGALVAGVAHELNTPIGNGVMAVTTLRDATAEFKARSAAGLKRSALDDFLRSVDTGSEIAARNLGRAAELIASFKQVAVDQTSNQRRRFHLREVVDEILLTLGPQLRHCVATIEVQVPADIALDSYPGALGQVLTNLIANAAAHAFEGRLRGTIRIEAEREGPDAMVLRVADDGVGIPEALLPRVFDPFVTTRMGKGGTGLGLHIVHNVVTQALGGKVRVASQDGTCFFIHLPLSAPLPAPAEA